MTAIIDTLRVTGLAGWVAFAILYHVGTRGAWRRSRFGPWIMTLALVPLLVLIVGLASGSFGSRTWWVEALRLMLMMVLNVLPLWLAAHLMRAQANRPAPPDRKEKDHEDFRA